MSNFQPPSTWTVLKRNLRYSGLQQIDAAIAEVEAQLQESNRSAVDRAILAGRRRELRSARWLVNQLFRSAATPLASELNAPNQLPESAIVPQQILLDPLGSPIETEPRSPQSALFEAVAAKLQSSLQNLTPTPIEIDILKFEKKRELLTIGLRKIQVSLVELQFSQVQPEELSTKSTIVLRDIWQAVINEFFGRYSTVRLGDRAVAIVEVLQQEADLVQTEILNKIPLVPEVLSHLLFQIPLAIDDDIYQAGTVEAMARSELLLQNLMIQIANAAIQPLINRFADVVEIKQTFYDLRLLSSREIERFRNDLSWRYRVKTSFQEPQAIFESRFDLWVIQESGLIRTSIYSPRNQELAALSGIQYWVTLLLETRDAIAPRLRSLISLLGSGIVYLLTEVIGRGIGLVGRGIVKGIGNAFQETRWNSDRRFR